MSATDKSFGFECDWNDSINWTSPSLKQHIVNLMMTDDSVQALCDFMVKQHRHGFAAGRKSVQIRIKNALEL
jgi:hypothetical protein